MDYVILRRLFFWYIQGSELADQDSSLHSQAGSSRLHQSQLCIARETDCLLYIGSIYVLSYYPLTLQMYHYLTPSPLPKKKKKRHVRAGESCYNNSILLVYSVTCHQVLLSSTRIKFFHNWIPQCSLQSSLVSLVPLGCRGGQQKPGWDKQEKRQGINHCHLYSQEPLNILHQCKVYFGASQLSPDLNGSYCGHEETRKKKLSLVCNQFPNFLQR